MTATLPCWPAGGISTGKAEDTRSGRAFVKLLEQRWDELAHLVDKLTGALAGERQHGGTGAV